jgi:hypothetical protein
MTEKRTRIDEWATPAWPPPCIDHPGKEGRMEPARRLRSVVAPLALLFLVAGAGLAAAGNTEARGPGDNAGRGTNVAYDPVGLDSLRLTDPARARLLDRPSIVVLQPRDFRDFRSGLGDDGDSSFRFPSGFSFRWPSFGDASDYGTSESRLSAVLQDELTQAFAASRTFNVLVPATGSMGADLGAIEAEGRVGRHRRDQPLDDEATAEYVFGSSVGVKAIERKGSALSGSSVAEALEGVMGDRLSWNDRRRLDVLRGVRVERSEAVVTVVVNGYVARGRTLLASGHGIGVTKFRRRQEVEVLGSGQAESRTEAYVFEAVRGAVQDLIDNLVPAGGTRQ